MPLIPILLKVMSSAMRTAAKAGVAKAQGTDFAEHYLKDFGVGVKQSFDFSRSGERDGQKAVRSIKDGLVKLFYDMPKEIGKRRWGEHMAGALVKVTGERLAAMNASLSVYGGSAQSYAQTMTSLADKAFRLGFGEAGWIPQLMKYTMGEYDPFGSGPNGMKTKEENLEWFKNRYDGRRDLVDEARTIGGILGITPDIVKLIIDGHRELLERGNHLTSDQVRASNELEFQSKKTQAAWQEVADIWGANTAGFWTGWEKFKEKVANGAKGILQGEKSDEDVKNEYEERLKGIYRDVKDRGLSEEDAKDWKGLRYHMTKGEGRTWSDEQLAEFAIAQEKAGVGNATENLARLRAVRYNPKRAYMIGTTARVLPNEMEDAKYQLDISDASQRVRKEAWRRWAKEKREEYDKEEFENEIANPKWFEGAIKYDPFSGGTDYKDSFSLDLKRFRKNLDGAPEKVRDYYMPMTDEEITHLLLRLKNSRKYDPGMKARHEAELAEPAELKARPWNRYLPTEQAPSNMMDYYYKPIEPPKTEKPVGPRIDATGTQGNVSCYGFPSGDRSMTLTNNVIVKSTEEGLRFVRQSTENGEAWIDSGMPLTPVSRGDSLFSTMYNAMA